MRVRFYTLDVFTDRRFGGNPLAVFPEASEIPEALFPTIARELNLSETVFVLPPSSPAAWRRLRIFTPGSELPFAGHPTVGTACLLLLLGEVPTEGAEASFVFEEGVGPIPVTVRRHGAESASAQLTATRLPEQGPPAPSIEDLATLLNVASTDILDGEDRPEAWSAGVPFLFIPVRDRSILGRVLLDPEIWKRRIAGFWAPHVYVFCRDPELQGSDLRARMFAPQMGIAEDPATGAAAAAFAGYLARRATERSGGTLRWRLEQGFEMGRPSLIEIEADQEEGSPRAVRVGGSALLMSEGTMRLADGLVAAAKPAT
jgi:trans-2,3-dihydro-3-hydroxyanthranilate isomerase